MLDLNNLKRVNDTLGHEMGTDILRAFQLYLQACRMNVLVRTV